MNSKIIIEQKAIDEIADAVKWCSEKSLIASENFKKEINEAFNYLLLSLNIEKYFLI